MEWSTACLTPSLTILEFNLIYYSWMKAVAFVSSRCTKGGEVPVNLLTKQHLETFTNVNFKNKKTSLKNRILYL